MRLGTRTRLRARLRLRANVEVEDEVRTIASSLNTKSTVPVVFWISTYSNPRSVVLSDQQTRIRELTTWLEAMLQ